MPVSLRARWVREDGKSSVHKHPTRELRYVCAWLPRERDKRDGLHNMKERIAQRMVAPTNKVRAEFIPRTEG